MNSFFNSNNIITGNPSVLLTGGQRTYSQDVFYSYIHFYNRVVESYHTLAQKFDPLTATIFISQLKNDIDSELRKAVQDIEAYKDKVIDIENDHSIGLLHMNPFSVSKTDLDKRILADKIYNQKRAIQEVISKAIKKNYPKRLVSLNPDSEKDRQEVENLLINKKFGPDLNEALINDIKSFFINHPDKVKYHASGKLNKQGSVRTFWQDKELSEKWGNYTIEQLSKLFERVHANLNS